MGHSHIHTEADLDAALAALGKVDPRFVPLLAEAGRPPLRRRSDGFAGLAAIIVAQQLSTASANAIWGRLAAAFDPLDPEAIMRANPGGASCCASKTSMPRAAGRNTKRRFTRISPGSASFGMRMFGGRASILTIIRPRSQSLKMMGSFIRASRPGPRLPHWLPSASGTAPGRAILMACRSILAEAAS